MNRPVAALLVCMLALVLAASAAAASSATLSDIEDEVMCPTCGTALALSEAPLADRQRAFIQRLIDQGQSKAEIKAQLVEEFGPKVLAAPPRSGFGLAAYLVPLIGLIVAFGSLTIGLRRGRRRPISPDILAPGDGFEDLVDADLAGSRR